jgi:hypothetical protein
MIRGIGTGLEVDWWKPVVLVAGRRAREQRPSLVSQARNLATKFGISITDISVFVDGWVAPLIATETTIPKDPRFDQKFCTCRANSAKKTIAGNDDYTVLNLNDVLDINNNTNITGVLFEGSSVKRWKPSNNQVFLYCSSCHGQFEGFVYEPEHATMYEFQFGGFTPFECSFLFSAWKDVIANFDNLGDDVDAVIMQQALIVLTRNMVEEDRNFGRDWKPASWTFDDTKLVFDKWVAAGADALTASMGSLMECIVFQRPEEYEPDSVALDILHDEALRHELVKRAGELLTTIPAEWSGLQWRNDENGKTRFQFLVELVSNDIDDELIKSMAFGAF